MGIHREAFGSAKGRRQAIGAEGAVRCAPHGGDGTIGSDLAQRRAQVPVQYKYPVGAVYGNGLQFAKLGR
ncbi:hypothetical protein D3C72_2030100 [compost metagenome]